MEKVISKDGTAIAFERSGAGPTAEHASRSDPEARRCGS